MIVKQVSEHVFDLEAETEDELILIGSMYDFMADDRRVPREHVKKGYEDPNASTPWWVKGIRFDARPAWELKRNPVCKVFSFIAKQPRLLWRKFAANC